MFLQRKAPSDGDPNLWEQASTDPSTDHLVKLLALKEEQEIKRAKLVLQAVQAAFSALHNTATRNYTGINRDNERNIKKLLETQDHRVEIGPSIVLCARFRAPPSPLNTPPLCRSKHCSQGRAAEKSQRSRRTSLQKREPEREASLAPLLLLCAILIKYSFSLSSCNQTPASLFAKGNLLPNLVCTDQGLPHREGRSSHVFVY